MIQALTYLFTYTVGQMIDGIPETEVDQETKEAVKIFLMMSLNQISEKEAMNQLRKLGFNVGGKSDMKLPDISEFMPQIKEEFGNYIRKELPLLFSGSDFMNEERLNGIVAEVEDLLSEDPPNMPGVLDIASDLNLSEEAQNKIMDDIKSYLTHIIEEILIK